MHGVARVGAQARVPHLEAKLLEVLCDAHRRRLLLLHAQRECLDAPRQQEALEWREAIADRLDREEHFRGQIVAVAREDTGHDVVVSTEVLGR